MTTQHNTTQHNTTQHNTTQHNTTQHNTKARYYSTFLALASATLVHAQTFEAYGVKDTNKLYGINLTAGATYIDEIGDTGVFAKNVNHLAFDSTNNRLLYRLEDRSRVYSYDLSTGTQSTVGTTSFTTKSTGGGTFYQGAYYLYHDETGLDGGLWKISFDASGNISTQTHLYNGGGAGDLGDIAFGDNGDIYGINNNDQWFTIQDLSGSPSLSIIKSNLGFTPSNQLFRDSEGRFLTTNNDGTYAAIDPTTGNVTANIGSHSTDGWRDLAGATAVPEPTSFSLVALGLTFGLLRRKR